MGGRARTYAGTTARDLDPDRNLWDQQPDETTKAYAAFRGFLDSEDRIVDALRDEYGGSVWRWSSEWSWGMRAAAWDRFMYTADQEELLRLRRQMNARHRAVSRLAIGKVAEWLASVDPSTMTPRDASRWFDVATRVERWANGGDVPLDVDPAEEARQQAATLAEMLQVDPNLEAELARMIHEGTRIERAAQNGHATPDSV